MNKKDIRVTKTKRAITDTFLKQICLKPVNKITVAGLAREAEINKGTFYLHYTDIFELYDEVLEKVVNVIIDKYDPFKDFFINPEIFVHGFFFTPFAPPLKEELAILKEENLRFTTKYPAIFVDAFRERLYNAGDLAHCKENDAKLEYLITGMLSLLIKPGLLDIANPSANSYIIDFLAGSIRQLFPQYYSAFKDS